MGDSEREIRNAAEVLLTGSCSSQLPRHASPHHYYASQTLNDDFYAAINLDGRMSDVRRFFCLLVTFDLLLTCLMWLICMMLVSGGDIVTSLTLQVVHYNIQTSMFDIVMAAASRFTILLLFYALLCSNSWFYVAITTAGTGVFLIAKVVLFDWTKASQPTFQVMLILVSFVLAWGEAWFLDYRVLSQERKAKNLLSSTLFNERNPLVQNFITNLGASRDNPESIANFYSPMDSSDESDNESCSRASVRNQLPDYQEQAQKILNAAWALINSPDWQLEKETAEGDTIHSKATSAGPKVFRLTAKVDSTPSVLLQLLFDCIEFMPQWNPTVIESKVLEFIDSQTDITYQVSAAGGGGVVASRDFVLLRHWEMRDGAFVSASASISYPKKPSTKQYIRGQNLPGCWVMKNIPGEDRSCVFQWLLNTNLNGWLPQYVVDSAFTNVMVEFLEHLKAHVKELPAIAT